tara:strand:+ start:851 stop:1114 length:264 start_codon:yes stop_codon:yes gene_type:complete
MDSTARIVLNSGDIIIDPDYQESGLLVMRFDVMAAFNHVSAEPVWAWDILWSGSRYNNSAGRRRAAYTENGLINMIECESFIHIKNI